MNVSGKVSWFGGPNDDGVAPDEGLAFIQKVEQAPELFLPVQPPGTTGLARRLNPRVHYLACRWDYNQTPRDELLARTATVSAPKTGRVFHDVSPADWGPHGNTGRVADISPGLMRNLGIETDDEVEVTFPASVAPPVVAQAPALLDPAAIDFSHHNGVTSFADIAAHGVVGMIAKATEGGSYKDPTYPQRIGPATSAGLLWGAYHFLRPGDMVQQANHFVSYAGDIDIYCADHEDPGVSLNSLKTFIAEVERLTGKVPVLYSGHVIKEQLGTASDPALARCRLWIAHYTSAAAPTWPTATWPTWWLWQYTENGNCPGLTGLIDVNRYQGTAAQLAADWTGPMRVASRRADLPSVVT